MKPFLISEKCRPLRETYPEPAVLGEALMDIGPLDLQAVVGLWISEGIPFAFMSTPILYQSVRQWMARCLQVDTKSITLIGSARIGYSLRKLPTYGRAFGEHSDLDFSIIDLSLFIGLVGAFSEWQSDVRDGRASPRNPNEERHWPENLRLLPDNIARGFIDSYKIPTRHRYPKVIAIQQVLYLLSERLRLTPDAPKIKKVSLRVYKDWGSFFKQVCFNFSLTADSLRNAKLAAPQSALKSVAVGTGAIQT